MEKSKNLPKVIHLKNYLDLNLDDVFRIYFSFCFYRTLFKLKIVIFLYNKGELLVYTLY